MKKRMRMKIEKRKDGLTVANRFYTAALSRRGGRMISLVRAGSAAELIYFPAEVPGLALRHPGGIAKEVECGHPGEMSYNLFQEDVLPTNGQTLRIRYAYHGRPGVFIRWSMKCEKTFTFHPDSPVITVEQSIRNIGEPELFAAFRTHNELKVHPDSVIVIPSTEGLKKIPAAASGAVFISNFTEGLIGIWHPDTKDALLLLPDYDAVAQFLVSTGKNSATPEWYYRSFTLGDNAVWTTSYRILPVAAESLDELTPTLASLGIKADMGRRDRRAQEALSIRSEVVDSREREKILARFSKTVVDQIVRESAFTQPTLEDNVALSGGSLCSRAIHTQPGAGMEVRLPEAPEILVSAEVSRRESGPGEAEAYLGCCDTEGNLYAVSPPTKLNFWTTEGTLSTLVHKFTNVF